MVLLPITLAMLASRHNRDVLAGCAIAAAALIKLVPALLMLFWLARRRYRALWGFVATTLAGVLLVALLGGYTRWIQFGAFVADNAGRDAITGLFPLTIVWSFSLKSVALRFLGSGPVASMLAYGAATAFISWLYWRTRQAPSDAL